VGFIIGALALDDANDINGCTFSDGFKQFDSKKVCEGLPRSGERLSSVLGAISVGTGTGSKAVLESMGSGWQSSESLESQICCTISPLCSD